MLNQNEIVTVCNRSSKTLNGTWNGVPYEYPPYPAQVRVPRIVAVASRYQNPVMGIGTPMESWLSKSEYLLGIVEDGDPVTPMEQSDAPQRFDTYLVNGPNTEVIRPRGAREEVRQVARTADVGFVKP